MDGRVCLGDMPFALISRPQLADNQPNPKPRQRTSRQADPRDAPALAATARTALTLLWRERVSWLDRPAPTPDAPTLLAGW
ncbi:hypothetical protein RMCFA_1333 [Mycolicibacterium fortuitum subsp. acetamidolyticum]|uniref:Uncharacterized protein n=1 Tax=Mycolicibacterium fortuitum subsp. acetamidolyticum TaxID=144550 RepID=A0A100WNB3_MYCFO|nr:hypothetical protein RMCFA_1333 [Mycolicibacterium fortuitum subsp. acetamidolyticum]